MNSNPYMNIHSIQLHIDELKPLYEYSFNPITPNPYMNIHSIQLHIDELKPLYEYSFNPITYR